MGDDYQDRGPVAVDASSSEQDAEELIENYRKLVYKIAHDLHKRLPDEVELEDLIAWGYMGLMEAHRRYDQQKSTRFATFAYYRIRGAMLDGVCQQGVESQTQRAEMGCNEVLSSYAHTVHAQGNQASIEGRLSMLSDVAGSMAMVFVLRDCPSRALSTEGAPQKRQLVRRQLNDKVRLTVKRLPEHERRILEGFYFDETSLTDLAAEMGYSISWASRIHARGLDRLRGLIENDETLEDLRYALPV